MDNAKISGSGNKKTAHFKNMVADCRRGSIAGADHLPFLPGGQGYLMAGFHACGAADIQCSIPFDLLGLCGLPPGQGI